MSDKETEYLLASEKNRERLLKSIEEAERGDVVELDFDDDEVVKDATSS